MMGRFLLYFSYVGSRYHGLQRQIWQEKSGHYMETVAGTLEQALACLNPSMPPKLITSSRTDAGVHALNNTAHIDLETSSKSSTDEYCPKIIAHTLNCYMKRNNHDIRIRKILRVNDDFHSRFNAIGRSYCYKVAKLREPYDDVVLHPVGPISALDLRRCSLIPVETDMDLLREGAELFTGTHDFSAFTGRLKSYQNPRKHIEISVHPSSGSLDYLLSDDLKLLEHYDILVTGNSFLYKQVRKMVGTLISYAIGKMTRETFVDLVENPDSYRNCNRLIQCLPPSGLYLVNVHYKPEELVYDLNRPARRDMQIENTQECNES